MTKKVMALLAAMVMTLGLCACSDDKGNENSSKKETTATTTAEKSSEDNSGDEEDKSSDEDSSNDENSEDESSEDSDEEQDGEITLAPEEEEAKSTFTTTEWDGKTLDKVDVKDVNKVVYDKDNIKVTITDIEANMNEDPSFGLNITTENKTGEEIVLNLEHIKVNGKAVDMMNESHETLFKDDEDGSFSSTLGEKRHFQLPAYYLVEYYNINYSDIKTISFNVVAYKDDISDKYRIGTGDRIVLNLKK